MLTVFIANWIDFGTFAALAEDRNDTDDWSFSADSGPRVGHVFATFDEASKIEALQKLAIDDYMSQFDVLQDKEWLDDVEAAVWHTAEWVKFSPFGDAEPKMLGRQEWTLASPEWDINDPDKRGGVEPILRLVVEQHRVF